MSNDYWMSKEDIDADFRAVSDVYDHSVKRSYKPSSYTRRSRFKRSIYLTDEEEEEDANEYVPCGRGAGFARKVNHLSPGKQFYLQKPEEITNDIREVCEFRFSSDAIEESLNHDRHLNGEHNSVSASTSTANVIVESPLRNASLNTLKEEVKPPPLYEIVTTAKLDYLRLCKERLAQGDSLKMEKDCDVYNSYQINDRMYDLKSKNDFPDL